MSAGFVRRVRTYLDEMLPVPRHLAAAALTYVGIAAFGRDVHGVAPPLWSPATAIGVWSVFGVFLILRLMDELKDRDLDRELFPERPLPSGRVLASDIERLLAAAIALYVLAHLGAGFAFWTALGVLGYLALMFRLFFVPDRLRRSLPLSLATHTPILPLIALQGFAIFAAECGLAPRDLRWSRVVPYVVMLWATYAAWEIARKTRRPGDETRYVTYSRLLGPAGAVLAAGLMQALAAGIAIHLGVALRLSWGYLALVLAGLGVALAADIRFLATADPRVRRLRPFAEVFAAAMLAAQALEFTWRVAGT